MGQPLWESLSMVRFAEKLIDVVRLSCIEQRGSSIEESIAEMNISVRRAMCVPSPASLQSLSGIVFILIGLTSHEGEAWWEGYEIARRQACDRDIYEKCIGLWRASLDGHSSKMRRLTSTECHHVRECEFI